MLLRQHVAARGLGIVVSDTGFIPSIVLEALECYIGAQSRQLPTFHLGEVKPWRRGDLYEARLKRQTPR